MEVLFLTGVLPYPPTSGATIRTYHLLRRLAARHRVHLVAFADPARDGDRAVLEGFCASVTAVARRDTTRTPRLYLDLARNLASPTPFIVDRFTTTEMAQTVRRLTASRRLDLVHCDFVTLSRNLPPPGGPPRILTAHNVESIIWRRYLAHERNPLKRLYIGLQYRKLLRFEATAPGGFRHVVCVSEDDAARLRQLCPGPTYTVVPNGVDLAYFQPRPREEVAHRLVFTGAMDWRPNQDAVRFFLDRIYPRIKRLEPRASLLVAGRQVPPALAGLAARHPDVSILGTVPDMRPHLATAAVYVVPLRIGGGTRLKILEAMAMARPVVSTSVGCEGLRATAGHEIAVADEPDAFARAVVRLLREPALAAAMGQAGMEMVKRAYGWDQIADTLDEAWSRTAAGEVR